MTREAANENWVRRHGWRVVRWSAGAILLSIPAIMMQISDEWNWQAGSFIFGGVMIGGVLGLYELAAQRPGTGPYRAGAAIALAASFLLIWINLAVGIVGEDNPLNLSFFGIVVTAIVSSFAGRFRPDGMARAMLGTGIVQGFLGVVIATAPSTALNPKGPLSVLLICAFFAMMWLSSAAAFHLAARRAAAGN